MGSVGVVSVGFGLLLALVHFFSENMSPAKGPTRFRVISFAAGISIAYLFLDLLPHTYEAAHNLRQWVFLFLLIGFSGFHLAEKYIYQHADRQVLAKELKEVHSVAFFAYHFFVGVALESKVREGIAEGVFFLVPVVLHSFLSGASMSSIHGEVRENLPTKILLSLSTLMGLVIALLLGVRPIVSNILISVIAGILLYVIVREFLPEKEEGRPLYFILGLTAFIALDLLLRNGGQ